MSSGRLRTNEKGYDGVVYGVCTLRGKNVRLEIATK